MLLRCPDPKGIGKRSSFITAKTNYGQKDTNLQQQEAKGEVTAGEEAG